jgi:hypothetical protein
LLSDGSYRRLAPPDHETVSAQDALLEELAETS